MPSVACGLQVEQVVNSLFPNKSGHAAVLQGLSNRVEDCLQRAAECRRWERTKEGEGQVVLLSGEPGLGKSRLVRGLHERLAGESHTLLSHFCSPYRTNSALYPMIGLLERGAGLRRGDPPDRQLDKLEAMLALAISDVEESAALFADLLGIISGRLPTLGAKPAD